MGAKRVAPPSGVEPASRAAPARVCAYAVLRRVFERGAYADEALQSEARKLDARDRALATRLAFGAVQRAGTLDHITARLAERPAERLDPALLAALRLGLYELLYLSGAPDRAVVADAVQLAKENASRGHGLVNAVLRRAQREGGAALLADLSDEDPAGAAVRHSQQRWVAELLWHELGPSEARALMAASNEPGERSLRANALAGDVEQVAAALPVPFHRDPALPEALVLEAAFDLHSSELWRSGAVQAQSRGSMLVSRALDPQPGERVLDLCAAPGAKTTHIAALMEGSGEVVAVERDARRARALLENVERLAAAGVRVEVGDASRPGAWGEGYDRVLVDPPCTGLGTLQAHPDLRWRLRAGDPQRLAAVQAGILAAGAQALRPGGVLLYSTCTISAIENEQLIGDFLESHPGFVLEDLPAAMPERRPAADAGPGRLCVVTLPHRDRTAGFFMARLRRD